MPLIREWLIFESRTLFENVGSLEQDLRTKYGLKRAIVVDQVGESYPQILEQLGQATANYLQEIVQDGDTIGLSWGRTMAAVADYLQPRANLQLKCNTK